MIKTKENTKEVNYIIYYLFGSIFLTFGIILTVTVSIGFVAFIVVWFIIFVVYKDKLFDKN